MPGHNLNHFTGKTRPAIKQKSKKKVRKAQKSHINKYATKTTKK